MKYWKKLLFLFNVQGYFVLLQFYDEALGDAEQQIAAGTNFDNLPENYQCFLCEASKDEFVATEESTFEVKNF